MSSGKSRKQAKPLPSIVLNRRAKVHNSRPMHLPHPQSDQISLPNVLSVLGDPTRLAIVAELARKDDGPVNCSHFLDICSKTNLSYHLGKLREAGVTHTEASGTSRFTTLRRADLDKRFPGLLDSVLAGAAGLAPPSPEKAETEQSV